MLATLSNSKPALRAIEKLDRAPRLAIEARIQKALQFLADPRQDTYAAWVRGRP